MFGEVRWLLHNVVAHPLLGIASTVHRFAVWLHDGSAPSLERQAIDLELGVRG